MRRLPDKATLEDFTDAQTFDEAEAIQADNTDHLPVFVDYCPALSHTIMKICKGMTSVSAVLIKNKKKINWYVGPSKLYLVMKGMKLENSEVITIKFIGTIPRLDMREYIYRRPNISTVITDLYGPICCTWSEFDMVRKNITSFVVCSRDGFLDICDFIHLSS